MRVTSNTYYTNARCPKCGALLKTSDLPDYALLCEKCDENFFCIEVKDISGDFFEINFPISIADYEKNEAYLLSKLEIVNPCFIGCDDVAGFLDVGWEDIPSADIIHKTVEIVEGRRKANEGNQ